MRSIVVLLALVLASCADTAAPARDPLAGVYQIVGGDSSRANVEALTAAFSEKHAGVKFQLDTSLDSDTAVKLAAAGTADLGMVSRELSASESDLVDRVLVGVAGTGLIVHQANPVQNLTSAQVEAIYSGTIVRWSALGGASRAIIPLMREKASSARLTFESFVYGGKPTYGPEVVEISGGEQMRRTVADLPGAIGMVGVSTNDPEVTGIRLVTLNGVAPTGASLRDGTYQLRRPLYLVVARNAEPKPAIRAFLDFVRSIEGQAILERF